MHTTTTHTNTDTNTTEESLSIATTSRRRADYLREWCQRNKDRLIAYRKQYYQDNKERLDEQNRLNKLKRKGEEGINS